MELIKNFGFDPVLFVAQIINFLIVLYILKKFLYKPILETLKKRKETISEGLKQAQEGRKLLEDASAREREILQAAQLNAQKIVDDAQKSAKELALKMQEDAKLQTQKMIADAKEEIQQDARETEKRLLTKVSTVATMMLEKSLKNLFGPDEQKKALQKAVKQLKKAD
ncbi:MAG TPA: F0F1 ATP synthase subunit B [Candidatus Saccharimonadales bacterium]|nr:F0F1 ATP synthase subunit B [Candidatus Saccharimonadales bacterium]